MPEEQSRDEICLFIRDEKTGWYAFNPHALRTLGIDPEAAEERISPTTRTVGAKRCCLKALSSARSLKERYEASMTVAGRSQQQTRLRGLSQHRRS